jgi:hypothetical protein
MSKEEETYEVTHEVMSFKSASGMEDYLKNRLEEGNVILHRVSSGRKHYKKLNSCGTWDVTVVVGDITPDESLPYDTSILTSKFLWLKKPNPRKDYGMESWGLAMLSKIRTEELKRKRGVKGANVVREEEEEEDN